jgi:SAM-dependent methyltransferase
MGIYGDKILPRLVDLVLRGAKFGELRARYLEGVSGEVFEVGFGSGLNLPHYPPEVTHLWALDPATVGRQIASRRLEDAPFPVELIGRTGEEIPLPTASVDAAVSTWTLCTIPDAAKALAEIRRVLRPRGGFRFIEHGRSPEPRVARWQDRLNPLQNRIAGGCNLNRKIDQLLLEAGFVLTRLDRFYLSGPKIGTYMYAGTAVKP